MGGSRGLVFLGWVRQFCVRSGFGDGGLGVVRRECLQRGCLLKPISKTKNL